MALVWLLSNCYQKASPNAANPHKHWGFTEVRFIPTRSRKPQFKQFCIGDLARVILVI